MLGHDLITYTGGSVATNGYLLQGPEGLIIIDAPAGIAEQIPVGLKPHSVLLTHQHFDHVEDVAALSALGAEVHAFAPYSTGLTLEDDARRWGMPVTIAPYEVSKVLQGQTELTVAGLPFSLLHVPGHSPDSLCFHLAEAGVVFGGDTLFAGSVGRTDLPGGQHHLFADEIRKNLLTLPGETVVHPGHGPSTTIGAEAATNPYLS